MLVLKLYDVLAPLRASSIGTRLYTAFAATAGLTIAAGLAANLSFVQIESSLTALTNHGVRALEASGALEAGALRLNAIAPELRSTTNPNARAGATARIDVEFEAVRSALDTLEAIGKIPVSGFDQDLVSFPGRRACRADVRASLIRGRYDCLTACQCRRFQIWIPCLSTS